MDDKFATELLHELKCVSRRWFIAFCIIVVLELITIGCFVWYATLPVDEETITQTVDDIDSSEITQVGGDYGESDTNN